MSTKKNKDQENNNIADQSPEPADCAKCAEYLAGWKRAMADYENLQREFKEKQQNFSKYAHEQMLMELLPAIDQFESALEHMPDLSKVPEAERKQLENWFIGIKAVNHLWEEMFNNIGLERVDTAGTFDPLIHNAVGKEEDPNQPQDQILKTVQTGWKLKGTILRPAKVIVNSIN
ncbi:MAG: nucleotide exchange factor GrpE [Patescibacteria group bacterium]